MSGIKFILSDFDKWSKDYGNNNIDVFDEIYLRLNKDTEFDFDLIFKYKDFAFFVKEKKSKIEWKDEFRSVCAFGFAGNFNYLEVEWHHLRLVFYPHTNECYGVFYACLISKPFDVSGTIKVKNLIPLESQFFKEINEAFSVAHPNFKADDLTNVTLQYLKNDYFDTYTN
jgi:hypothetical protein